MSEDPVTYGVAQPGEPAGRRGWCEAAGRVEPAAVRAAWAKALARARLTGAQVAAVCKVTPATVAAWQSGRRRPSVGHLLRASAALGTSPADLLGWWGEAPAGWVNGDEVRRALAGSALREVSAPAERLSMLHDFVVGMAGISRAERVEALHRALARILAQLADLEACPAQESCVVRGVAYPEGDGG